MSRHNEGERGDNFYQKHLENRSRLHVIMFALRNETMDSIQIQHMLSEAIEIMIDEFGR